MRVCERDVNVNFNSATILKLLHFILNLKEKNL